MNPYRPIPPVTETPEAIRETIDALRENQEIQTRNRGALLDSFVSLKDLIDLGLIDAGDLSKLTRR